MSHLRNISSPHELTDTEHSVLRAGEDDSFFNENPHLYYLKAFEDADLLSRRILAPSKIFKVNPDLRQMTLEAITDPADGDTSELVELLGIARQLDDSAGSKPVNKVFTALNFAAELSLSLFDMELYTDTNAWRRGGEVYESFVVDMVKSIPESELADHAKTVDGMSRLIRRANVPAFGRVDVSWLLHRLRTMGEDINDRLDNVDYVESLPVTEGTPVSVEQASRDTQEIAILFEEARHRQAYGVKLAYKNKDGGDGSFVFAPPHILNDQFGDMGEKKDLPDVNRYNRAFSLLSHTTLASIIDTDDLEFKKGMKMKFKLDDMNRVKWSSSLDTVNAVLGIDFDGELIAQVGTTTERLVDIAVRQKRYNSYRILQAEILRNYLDLVCPADSVENPDQNRELASPLTHTHDAHGGEEQSGTDVVRALLVRRIKENIHEAPETGGHRSVRLHGVVWHIRKLSAGWRASPEAQALALEAHVTLQENETFVRSHTRGNKALGEVVLHKMVRVTPDS